MKKEFKYLVANKQGGVKNFKTKEEAVVYRSDLAAKGYNRMFIEKTSSNVKVDNSSVVFKRRKPMTYLESMANRRSY